MNDARRPPAVTLAVVIVYVGGIANTVLGVLLLLSRYRVPSDDVLSVSLLGIAVALLGLLTVSGASALARGSRLARGLVTSYLGLLAVLQIVAMTTTTRDVWPSAFIATELIVIVLLWIPASSRFMRTSAAPRV